MLQMGQAHRQPAATRMTLSLSTNRQLGTFAKKRSGFRQKTTLFDFQGFAALPRRRYGRRLVFREIKLLPADPIGHGGVSESHFTGVVDFIPFGVAIGEQDVLALAVDLPEFSDRVAAAPPTQFCE